MPLSLVILLPGSDFKRQNILLRRQRTGGIGGKDAGWIIGLIKINIGNVVGIRRVHIQEAACSIGFDPISLIPKDHKEFLIIRLGNRV